jgi:hypothetical protein
MEQIYLFHIFMLENTNPELMWTVEKVPNQLAQ